MAIELQDNAFVTAPLEDCWCRDHTGSPYTFQAFSKLAEAFHGYPAPGLLVGARMVHDAMMRLPDRILFDALCETAACLPDAVQLLTPCTTGNGWLRVVPLGRFALTLFDKRTGYGIRTALSPDRLNAWPAIADWFFKRTARHDQDPKALRSAIQKAGSRVLVASRTRVRSEYLNKRRIGATGICSSCGESFPARCGSLCLACLGQSPYERD